MELVVARGLEGFTTHGLAAELDLAVGALYRYFPSKDAIVGGLQRRALAGYRQDLEATLARAERLVGEREDAPGRLFPLVLIARRYREMAVEQPARFRLLNLMLADPALVLSVEEGGRAVASVVGLQGLVAEPFRRAAEAEALDPGDAGERTLLYWSALRGVLQVAKLRAYAPDLVDPERLVREAASAMLVGWGARREDVEAAWRIAARSGDGGGER